MYISCLSQFNNKIHLVIRHHTFSAVNKASLNNIMSCRFGRCVSLISPPVYLAKYRFVYRFWSECWDGFCEKLRVTFHWAGQCPSVRPPARCPNARWCLWPPGVATATLWTGSMLDRTVGPGVQNTTETWHYGMVREPQLGRLLPRALSQRRPWVFGCLPKFRLHSQGVMQNKNNSPWTSWRLKLRALLSS
jgi:hypothetical protein